MKVYIDTSAFLSILNRDEGQHAEAAKIWLRLLETGIPLCTNSYVVIETAAILQNRLGLDAVRTFFAAIYPLLEIVWVDAELIGLAVPLLFAADRRGLSLVDCTSFLAMQRAGLKRVFAFDRHFEEQGFEVLKS
jgi:uncharacterized protein